MSKSVITRALLGSITVGVALLGLSLAYNNTALAQSKPPAPGATGDLNRDGVTNLGDLPAFLEALADPTGWAGAHGLTASQLLEIVDFNADGVFTVSDREGFCLAIAPGGESESEGAAAGLMGGAVMTLTGGAGEIDLDIDSDNNNNVFPADPNNAACQGFPGRTAYEDQIENDPNDAGKLIVLDGSLAVLVLQITPDPNAATPPTNFIDYRFTYDNDTIRVWQYDEDRYPNVAWDTWDPNDASTVYSERVWVLGDMDGNGSFGMEDVSPLILALNNFESWRTQYLNPSTYPDMQYRAHAVADFNGDGRTGMADVTPFAAALSAPNWVTQYVPVWGLVEGLDYGVASGLPDIEAAADTNDDATIDSSDADEDTVRTTVDRPAVGAPPAWGAGMGISPFSTINLESGNVLTAINLVGWDPVGPPIAFTLYHNSLTDAAETDPNAWGFDLGAGWSVSYGSHIVADPNDTTQPAIVVGADGARDAYVYDTDHYEAPAGVHNILTWDPNAAEWTLRTPGQWLAIFDSAGRLTEVQDSAGNVLTVARDASHNYRIDAIITAADFEDPNDPNNSVVNDLRLAYDPNSGQLVSVKSPMLREWTFEYDGSGRLWKINYPTTGYDPVIDHALIAVAESFVEIEYEPSTDRIQEITTRDEKEWTYAYYADGRLHEVVTPNVADPNQTPVYYTEWFAYARRLNDGLCTTTYTDRRSHNWQYRFDAAKNLRTVTTPVAGPNNTRSFTFDGDHNLLTRTDELGHTWTYTWGPVGNMLTVTSPLTTPYTQTWTMTWDAPGVGEPGNLYRLAQVSDPANPSGYTVQYEYDDPLDPTLVTTVTEPIADPNDGWSTTANTTIEYYGSDPDERHARGQVRLVTDANGVEHLFLYDRYGFYQGEEEGTALGQRAEFETYISPRVASNPEGGQDAGEGTGRNGVIENDADGNPTGNSCCLAGEPEGDGSKKVEYCPGFFYVRDRGPNGIRLLGTVPTLYDLSKLPSGWFEAEYDSGQRLHRMSSDVPPDALNDLWIFSRWEYGYDGLGRVKSMTHVPNDADPWDELTRVWLYTYDADGRPLTVEGPDAQRGVDNYTYDDLGRVRTIRSGDMGVRYTYDDAGRLTLIEYGGDPNNPAAAKIVRTYDDADRLTQIEHRDPNDAILLRLTYLWNADNTLSRRTEWNGDLNTDPVRCDFTYDARKRLVTEWRQIVGQAPALYSLTYTYDQLGNRTSKREWVSDTITVYTYDTDFDPDDPNFPDNYPDPNFPTRNNRLLYYRIYGPVNQDPSSPFDGRQLLRTVTYTYFDTGNVAHITIKDNAAPGTGSPPAYQRLYDLEFVYSRNDVLSFVFWKSWLPGEENDRDAWVISDAWEFRGTGGRQRTLARQWDVEVMPAPTYLMGTEVATTFTDYLGEQPYVDYTATFDPNTYTVSTAEQRRYLAGFGVHADQEPNGPATYHHGDLIRSTMLLTDQSGAANQMAAYTAFGEMVRPSGTIGHDPSAALPSRYQYAGGWGYESGVISLYGANPNLPPVTLMHVGARWYQPDVGRFVQRDPIGILGGFNCYAYCGSSPLVRVDPNGLYWDYDDVTNPDGSITRHFYDRGWTGWFKNEYQYSVTIPPGKTPPRPPRTFDQRCIAVGKTVIVSAHLGGITGAYTGAAGGPEGIIIGVLTGELVGGITGLIGGLINELEEK